MNENNKITKKNDLNLFIMHALLGHITSNIRLVSIKYDQTTVDLYFVFDGKITQNDLQNAEEVKQKMQIDLPTDTISLHCIRIDVPERPRIGASGMFMRKEVF